MEGEHATLTPACPSCGNPMPLVRAIPASGLPELRTYDCRQCGVTMTEAATRNSLRRLPPIALPSFMIFSTMVLWSVFLTLSPIRKWINAIQP